MPSRKIAQPFYQRNAGARDLLQIEAKGDQVLTLDAAAGSDGPGRAQGVR